MFTQREILLEMKKFVRVNSVHGTLLFVTDLLMYIVLIYGVLYLPFLWMKCIASLGAGFKIANLATIAHDAAHNSLTKYRTLNKLIAVVSFMPGLFNYQLWLYDHHRLHHARTNENIPDSYTPISKKQYDNLPIYRRWWERIYRKPSVLFFGVYYIVERWSKAKLYPRKYIPREMHASAWRYFWLNMAYLASYITLLMFAPVYSATSAVMAIIMGFIIPYYVFQSLYAFSVYVQHTHPRVPWFDVPPDRNSYGRQEFISVHLIFPGWFRMLVHNVYDHAAHHVCPAIPCYQLGQAQARLNEMLGERSVSQQFSFACLFKTMQICKLYDYEHHRWLDFDGKPTSEVPLITDKIMYADAA